MSLALSHSSGAHHPRRVFLAVPAYQQVSGITTLALFRAHTALLDAGWGVELHILVGECHCDDARNMLVRDFLKSDCTDLVFIDADVGFDQHDITRLLSHDRDVVGGAYPKKQDTVEYPVRLLDGEIWSDADGLIEIEAIATGFLRIRRPVLERLAFIGESYVINGQHDGPIPLIFERDVHDGARWSGDNNFCRKWRAQGGKVYVDPNLLLEHEGTRIWSGTLASHLKRKNGLALAEQIERIKAGTETDRDYIDLMLEWANDPWNAGVELLKGCVQAARLVDGPILETGSGLTTLLMAAANPKQAVHCLEHSPVWAARVSEEARRLRLFNIVIHCAPMTTVNGAKWYDTTGLPHADWALVLNDGPPRQEGDRSVLWQTVGSTLNGALVLVDDVDDPAQRQPMEAWAQATGRSVQIMGQMRPFGVVKQAKHKKQEAA